MVPRAGLGQHLRLHPRVVHIWQCSAECALRWMVLLACRRNRNSSGLQAQELPAAKLWHIRGLILWDYRDHRWGQHPLTQIERSRKWIP